MLNGMKTVILFCIAIAIWVILRTEFYSVNNYRFTGKVPRIASGQYSAYSIEEMSFTVSKPTTKKLKMNTPKKISSKSIQRKSIYFPGVNLSFASNTSYTYNRVGKHYSGPIVEGWPPSKSRYIPSYINKQTVLYDLQKDCPMKEQKSNFALIGGNLKLLIMQHSSPTNFDARTSSRRTWMKLMQVHKRNIAAKLCMKY